MNLLKKFSALILSAVVLVFAYACTFKPDWKVQTTTIKKGETIQSEKDIKTPEREGFDFKGWYTTPRGRTWLEKEPVKFPYTAANKTTLYAYFEPKDYKNYNWSKQVTYKNAFAENKTDPILNPYSYHFAHESDLYDYLTTPLFERDINWDAAIEKGLVSKKGDLSKLTKDNYGALEQEYVLAGAAAFPEIIEGQDAGKSAVDDKGHYQEVAAGKLSGTKFRFKLNPNVKWEDGKPVTSKDYLFAFLQLIDGKLNYFRSATWVTSADRKNGSLIKKVREYYLQGNKLGLNENKKDKPDYALYEVTLHIKDIDYKIIKYLTKTELNTYLPGYELGTEINLVNADGTLIKNALELAQISEKALNKYKPTFKATQNKYYIGEKDTIAPEVKPEDLGFKIIDDYTFEIEYEQPIQLSSALGRFVALKLVHKEAYEKSITKDGKYQYGTPQFKPLSYGPYVLKTWDSKQKMVYNKNYGSEQSLKHNYKSISFEFMETLDQKMKAFDRGEIDGTGLNGDYIGKYLEHKTFRKSIIGYAQNLVLNPNEYKGKAEGTADMIKNTKFRRALFFGFNRQDFNKTVNVPNDTSIFPYPINATQYDNDSQFYLQTKEYKDMIKRLGIPEDGYDKKKALQLFNEAYAEWSKKYQGPVKIKFVTTTGPTTEKIAKYITEEYTKLFGKDKIQFTIEIHKDDVASTKMDNREFDMALSAVGHGGATNTSVEMPIQSFFYTRSMGKSQFGFSDAKEFGLDEDKDFEITEENKLDLRRTYNFLKENKAKFHAKTDSGYLKPLYDILEKNNGYFIGDSKIIYDYGIYCHFIWAGNKPQYDGDVEDRNTVTRFFNELTLKYCTLIPVSSRASAAVFSKDYRTEWPGFHTIMKWGFSRYNYLNSDPDFRK